MSAAPPLGPHLRLERLDLAPGTHAARITLNRPQQMNALDNALCVDLLEALRYVQREPAFQALILTGAGNAFCAGQDLNEAAQLAGQMLGEHAGRRYGPIMRLLYEFPKPTLAQVNGVAAGTGAALALACDAAIAAHDARMHFAFMQVGLVPDAGTTYILPRLVGFRRALELLTLPHPLSADEAQAMGLLNRVVAHVELEPTTRSLALGMCRAAPVAYRLTKSLLMHSWDRKLEAQLIAEDDAQNTTGASDDFREGLKAFFEKRPPQFTGQ